MIYYIFLLIGALSLQTFSDKNTIILLIIFRHVQVSLNLRLCLDNLTFNTLDKHKTSARHKTETDEPVPWSVFFFRKKRREIENKTCINLLHHFCTGHTSLDATRLKFTPLGIHPVHSIATADAADIWDWSGPNSACLQATSEQEVWSIVYSKCHILSLNSKPGRYEPPGYHAVKLMWSCASLV